MLATKEPPLGVVWQVDLPSKKSAAFDCYKERLTVGGEIVVVRKERNTAKRFHQSTTTYGGSNWVGGGGAGVGGGYTDLGRGGEGGGVGWEGGADCGWWGLCGGWGGLVEGGRGGGWPAKKPSNLLRTGGEQLWWEGGGGSR